MIYKQFTYSKYINSLSSTLRKIVGYHFYDTIHPLIYIKRTVQRKVMDISIYISKELEKPHNLVLKTIKTLSQNLLTPCHRHFVRQLVITFQIQFTQYFT